MFQSPQILIYLQSKNLTFFLPNSKSLTFLFTQDLIENFEIKNPQELENQLLKFISDNKIKKGPAIIVLSEDTVFQKDIVDKDPEKFKISINKFLDEIPLDPQKIAYKVLEIKQKYTLAAANKELFGKIKFILEKYGLKIKSIIPLNASWVGTINLETATEILKDKKIINRFNFLDKNLTNDQIKAQKGPPKQHKLLLIIIIILFTAIVSEGIFYFFLSSQKNKQENITNIPAPTTKPSPTPLPTKKAAVITKSKIDKTAVKIQVLNGNGGVGVATKGKTILEEKGYQNIEIGNAGQYDYPNTTISVKENKEDLYKILFSDLKSDYSLKTDPEILKPDSLYDAVIIIGQK